MFALRPPASFKSGLVEQLLQIQCIINFQTVYFVSQRDLSGPDTFVQVKNIVIYWIIHKN